MPDMYNNVACGRPRAPEDRGGDGRQQATLNTHSRYLSEPAIALAERLTSLQRVDRKRDLQLLRHRSRRDRHPCRPHRHWRAGACLHRPHLPRQQHAGRRLTEPCRRRGRPGLRAIPFPESLRPIESGLTGEALADAYVARMIAAIEDLKATGAGFAALILCPILANEGLPDIPATFMAKAAAAGARGGRPDHRG